MLRYLLPLFLVCGVLVVIIWLVGDAAYALRSRRQGRLDRELAVRDEEQRTRETDAVRRARLSLVRARDAKACDRVTTLLQEPDLDLLPDGQVATLLVAVEDLGDAGSGQGQDHGEVPADVAAYEAAVVRVETLVAAAGRDLRAARLAGGGTDLD